MPAVRTTYRVQLHSGFRLAELRELVPYLARLGVTHVYLSPLLRARSGSSHGYDVVDPTRLNPEVGDERDLSELASTLQAHGMGALLDIVPNHMAIGRENPFWENVLAHGPSSPYARWFDIDWGPEDARRPYRILLPVLGARLARVLERGELRVTYEHGFRLAYFEHSFPVDPSTIPYILGFPVPAGAGTADATPRGPLEEIAVRLGQLPARNVRIPEIAARRQANSTEILRDLDDLYERSTLARASIQTAVDRFSPSAGGSRHLRRLLAAQAYRLAYWRRAAREINYRRFFTISHLIALRVEDPTVFGATHERVLAWIGDGIFDSLRIDHIDGLLDPREYLERLADALRNRTPSTAHAVPVLVEKILTRDERLPEDWPAAGTTGYDFLAEVGDIFIDPAGLREIEAGYVRFTGRRTRFHDVARAAKRRALLGPLLAETRRLARLLRAIARDDPRHPELETEALVPAIAETLAGLRVYRTYWDPRRPGHRKLDEKRLRRALEEARLAGRVEDTPLQLLTDALLLDDPPSSKEARLRRQRFVQRFQQTGVSAAAKGVEDTAFYVHVPLLSRNEVGAEPDVPPAGALEALHAANRIRADRWPGSMLCVSTHDTKRSADVRARIDVLSELPEEWRRRVRRWHRWNRKHRRRVRWRYFPDLNTEYLLYQSLVGVWPPDLDSSETSSSSRAELQSLTERVDAYMLKAAREAKTHTSWVDPDPDFEASLGAFVRAVLSPKESSRFLADLTDFVSLISLPGFWNSLARTLVQLTAPGSPDIFQGDELWNFSLVDPDNRRPVDYSRRIELLERIAGRPEAEGTADEPDLYDLLATPGDGRVKLYLIHRTLQARRGNPELFSDGGYRPLGAAGAGAAHVFAFARDHEAGSAAIIIVPRLVYSLARSTPPIGAIWSDTRLSLPPDLSQRRWQNALTGESVWPAANPGSADIRLAEALARFPVALLLSTGS